MKTTLLSILLCMLFGSTSAQDLRQKDSFWLDTLNNCFLEINSDTTYIAITNKERLKNSEYDRSGELLCLSDIERFVKDSTMECTPIWTFFNRHKSKVIGKIITIPNSPQLIVLDSAITAIIDDDLVFKTYQYQMISEETGMNITFELRYVGELMDLEVPYIVSFPPTNQYLIFVKLKTRDDSPEALRYFSSETIIIGEGIKK